MKYAVAPAITESHIHTHTLIAFTHAYVFKCARVCLKRSFAAANMLIYFDTNALVYKYTHIHACRHMHMRILFCIAHTHTHTYGEFIINRKPGKTKCTNYVHISKILPAARINLSQSFAATHTDVHSYTQTHTDV